eukprot:gene3944-14021_t
MVEDKTAYPGACFNPAAFQSAIGKRCEKHWAPEREREACLCLEDEADKARAKADSLRVTAQLAQLGLPKKEKEEKETAAEQQQQQQQPVFVADTL